MAQKKKQVQITEQQALEGFRQEQGRLSALKRALTEIQMGLGEMNTTKEILSELKKTRQGECIMIGAGSGVYVSGSIDNTKAVHFTLGGNVVKKKSIPDALAALEKMLENARKQQQAIQQEAAKAQANVDGLSRLLIQAQRIRQGQLHP